MEPLCNGDQLGWVPLPGTLLHTVLWVLWSCPSALSPYSSPKVCVYLYLQIGKRLHSKSHARVALSSLGLVYILPVTNHCSDLTLRVCEGLCDHPESL